MSPVVDTDELIARLTPLHPGVGAGPGPACTTAPGRAHRHAPGVATTHGTFDLGTGWVAELTGEWTAAEMR